MKWNLGQTLLLWTAFFVAMNASAGGNFTYTGRILDAAGSPVVANSVRFTLTIYEPTGKCWLYTEQRELDLSASAGTFSIDIGANDASLVAATALFNGSVTGPQSMRDVFDNGKSYSGLGGANGCTGTYTPNSSEPNVGRLLSVFFTVDGGPNQALPVLRINPVPAALQAYAVNGFGSGELLKINPTDVAASSVPNNALTQTQYEEFWRLVKNPLAAYLPVSGDVTLVSGNNKLTTLLGQTLPAGPATNGQVLVSNGTTWTLQAVGSGSVTSVGGTAPIASSGGATPTISISKADSSTDGYLDKTDFAAFSAKQSNALADGAVWIGNSSGGAQVRVMSGDATLSNAGVLTLASTITASGPVGTSGYVPVITYDAKGRLTAVTSAAVNDSSKLPLAGGTMSGAINMGGQDITNTGNISMAANNYFGLSANSTNGTIAGQMWYDAGTIKYYDGSTVRSLGVAGAGITNLNGLTSSTQTFAVGTSGNAPAFSSVTNTHTLNIPMASASGSVTAGLLSNSEYAALNAKQSSALASANVWVGNASGAAEARALTGDISFDNTGATSLVAIKGKALDVTAASTMGQVLFYDSVADKWKVSVAAAPTNGQVMKWNDTTKTWEPGNDAGGWTAVDATYAAKGIVQFDTDAATSGINVSSGIASVVRTTTGTANTIVALDGFGTTNLYGLGILGAVSGVVVLRSSATTTNYALTLPNSAPSAGQSLQSDGSGNLSWVSVLNSVSDSANLTNSKIWVGNSSGKAVEVSMSGDATISSTGALTLASTITAGGPVGTSGYVPVITYDAKGRLTTVTSAAVNDISKLPLAGGTMSGSINMGGQDITNTGSISMAANNYFGLSANNTNGTVAGQMWYDTGTIKYFDGSSVKSLGVVGSGDNLGNHTATQNIQMGSYYLSGDGGNEGIRIDSNGRVGVGGVTTPNAPLDVQGASTAQTDNGFANFRDSSNNGLAIGYDNNASRNWAWLYGRSAGVTSRPIALFAHNYDQTPDLFVDNAKVGIKTSTPGAELDVKGEIRMSGATSGYVGFRPAAAAGSTVWTLPTADGSANQVLQTNGSGVLSWTSSVNDNTKLPLSGGTMSGDINMNGNDLINLYLGAGRFFVGNASNGADTVLMSGDATMSPSGVVTVDKTTTAVANKILQLDANSVANTSGVNITKNENTAYSTSSASLKIPAGGASISVNNWQEASSTASYIKMNAHNASGNDQYAYIGTVSTAGPGAWTPSIVFGQSSGSAAYTETMRIHSNNNVGVGATAPATKLDVSGVTRSTGFDVNATYGGSQASIRAPGAFTSYTLTLPTSTGANGQMLTTNGSGVLSWTTPLSTVSDSANLGTNNIWVGNASGKAIEVSMSGDATMSSTGAVTVDKTQAAVASKILQLTASSVAVTKGADIGGASTGIVSLRYPSTATNTTLTFPSTTGSANQFLQTNGSGVLTWATPAATLPTLTATNIWVGNVSGGPEARVLSGDVSAVSNTGAVTVVKSTTGTANQIVALDGTSVGTMAGVKLPSGAFNTTLTAATTATGTYVLRLPAAQGSANQVMQNDGSGNLSWVTPVTTSTGIVKDGNSFGAHLIIGTNDNYDFRFESNGATAMTIEPSGEVGIGTTTPGYKLDVASTDGSAIRANTYSATAYQGSNVMLYRARGTAGSPTAVQANDTLGGVYTRGYGATGFGSSSTAYLEFSAAQNFTDANRGTYMSFYTTANNASTPSEKVRLSEAGYLGIGTISPDSQLHIAGAGTIVSRIESTDTGRAVQAFLRNGVYAWDHGVNVDSSGTNNFQIREDGTTVRMTIQDTTGNVGIGTTTPSQLLDVDSSFDGGRAIRIGNTHATGASTTAAFVAANDKNGIQVGITGSGSTNLGFGAPGDSFIYNAAGTATGKNLNIINNQSGKIQFYNSSTAAGTSRLVIESDGSVGIGTATPVGMFSNYASNVLDANAIGGGSDGLLWSANTIGYSGVFENRDSTTTNRNGLLVKTATSSSSSYIARFESAGSNKMTIRADGNVGIGNTAPLEKLQVSGDILLNSRVSFQDNARLTVTNTDVPTLSPASFSMPQHGIAAPLSGSSAEFWVSGYNGIRFFTSGSAAPKMSLAAGGGVAIGHVTPSYTLHVNGSVAGVGAYVNASDQRLKENIQVIPDSLQKISQLRGVRFDWRQGEYPQYEFGQKHDIGVIAQEIEKVFPEAVTKDKDGIKAVAYSKLVAPLIEAVKALYTKTSDQDEKIKKLEAENAALKQDLKQIKEKLGLR